MRLWVGGTHMNFMILTKCLVCSATSTETATTTVTSTISTSASSSSSASTSAGASAGGSSSDPTSPAATTTTGTTATTTLAPLVSPCLVTRTLSSAYSCCSLRMFTPAPRQDLHANTQLLHHITEPLMSPWQHRCHCHSTQTDVIANNSYESSSQHRNRWVIITTVKRTCHHNTETKLLSAIIAKNKNECLAIKICSIASPLPQKTKTKSYFISSNAS